MGTTNSIGKIVVTEQLQEIIDALHNEIRNVEWSGVLFYKLISGDIKKRKDLVFEAKYFYPLDIGTTATTEFDYSGELMNAYDIFPDDAMDCGTALLHSHYALGSYFSGTDMAEIKNNAKSYNFYISMVVSFKRDYVCKIAFPSVDIVKTTHTFKDELGKSYSLNSTHNSESVQIYDLDVEYAVPESNKILWINSQVAKLNKPKPVSTNNTNKVFKTYTNDFDDYDFINGWGNTKPMYKPVVSLHEQFLINLMNVVADGKNLKECFESLKLIEDSEDSVHSLGEFQLAIEENFEAIYWEVFKKDDSIDRKNTYKILGILVDNNAAYYEVPAFNSIKDLVIQYL